MNPQQKPAAKPLLTVVCPQVQGIGFDVFRKWIAKGIEFAKERANGSWNGRSLVLLFQEMIVDTRWDTPHEEMVTEVEAVRKILPANVHVFFSAAQLDENGVPANMGWLVSNEGKKHQPKRTMGRGDERDIDCHYTDSKMKMLWKMRANKLENEKTHFLSFILRSGIEVECRVCADVRAEPIGFNLEKIALVAADGLPQTNIGSIALARKIMIVNDEGKCLDGTFGGGLRYKSMAVEKEKILVEKTSDFHSITILE